MKSLKFNRKKYKTKSMSQGWSQRTLFLNKLFTKY